MTLPDKRVWRTSCVEALFHKCWFIFITLVYSSIIPNNVCACCNERVYDLGPSCFVLSVQTAVNDCEVGLVCGGKGCSVVLLVGYDVQSAYTPDGVLHITGAPRFNHSGRVTVYRFDGENVTVTQTLKGEQVASKPQPQTIWVDLAKKDHIYPQKTKETI